MSDFISEQDKTDIYGYSIFEKGLQILSGKWRIRIIYILLYDGQKRYGELKRLLPGITHKMLSNELKELEKNNIINRQQYNEVPLRVEYSLTDKGEALKPILFSLSQWILQLDNQ
ncbi:winged helix-turn-helix transcriptional regulator [Culicoidibacter larvae]|uniref:Winged helix-turn-helix transcriptional regulator n=1 Tax=Culicoidibacter larvae TaxID=2579976 RepID=A0A5R8QCP9_9FIRM|nr:winged helix-turn-helix transcriptional regulator [Culicoidibacter larvae]TLG74305.1 winged helix-turn-helix transcriptional regulator [Culicoidibacter larvae]